MIRVTRSTVVLSLIFVAAPAAAKELTHKMLLGPGSAIAGLVITASTAAITTRLPGSKIDDWRFAELDLSADTHWCGVVLPAGSRVGLARNELIDWRRFKLAEERDPMKLMESIDDSYALRSLNEPKPTGLYLYFRPQQPLELGALLVGPARTVLECGVTADGRGSLRSVIQATLARPQTWRGFEIPAGTDLSWYPSIAGGGLAIWQRLDRDRTFDRIGVPKDADISFHPNGKPRFVGRLSSRGVTQYSRMEVRVPLDAGGIVRCDSDVMFDLDGRLTRCSKLPD